MSPSIGIEQLRQQRNEAKSDVERFQNELDICQKSVVDLESELRGLEEGDEGIFTHLARLTQAAKYTQTHKVVSLP